MFDCDHSTSALQFVIYCLVYLSAINKQTALITLIIQPILLLVTAAAAHRVH